MAFKSSNPARKFAQGISEAFSAQRFRKGLRKAVRQSEQKAAAKPIREYLHEFLKAEWAGSALPAASFDWEGKYRRQLKQSRSYPILGTWTWPDAAVLRPFRCAFEFDREPRLGVSHFKTALMKASVHVLSGNYKACVFVYFLHPGRTQHGYLDPSCQYTQRLMKTLRAKGLYVAMVSNRSV
jgi:hypothetical protein